MNFEFIKFYQDGKNILKEEHSRIYGLFILYILVGYIFHNLFILYVGVINIWYFTILLVLFIFLFSIWCFKYMYIKYLRKGINILFFPFEDSMLNDSLDKKYQLNDEIYKSIYNGMTISKDYFFSKDINIIKMNYKYENLSDNELLKYFNNSQADIIVRGKIIKNNNNIIIKPIILFTNNFKTNQLSKMRYLIVIWNIISILYSFNGIKINLKDEENLEKSIEKFNLYITDIFFLVFALIYFIENGFKEKLLYLNNFLEALTSMKYKLGDLFDFYIDYILLYIHNNLTDLDGIDVEKLYKELYVIMMKHQNIILKNEIYFSLLHKMGDYYYSHKNFQKSKEYYELSFKYKPNRHALMGLYNLFLHNNFFKIEVIEKLIDEFIYCQSNKIYLYAGYKIKGLLLIEKIGKIKEGIIFLEKALAVLLQYKERGSEESFIDSEIKDITDKIKAFKI